MDLFRLKKSIKIFMCSVLTIVVMATSALSFSLRSSAMTIYSGIDSVSFLSSLYSLLLSGKVVMDNYNNPFPSSFITSNDIDEYLEFFEKANEYQDGLGDDLKSLVLSGALNGTMTLDEASRENFLDYLEYCQGAAPIYKVQDKYPLVSSGYTTTITYRYHTIADPTVQTDTVTMKFNSPYFLALEETLTQPYYSYVIYFISKNNSEPIWTLNSTSNNRATSVNVFNDTFIDSENHTYYRNIGKVFIANWYAGNPYYVTDSISVSTQFWPGINRFFSKTNLADMLYSITNTDYATLTSTSTTTALSSTDDVISRTSTVSDTGEIESNFVLSVPQYEKLINVIDAVRSGVLSLKDALASLSLSSVKNTATVQEKQQAISDLVETVPATSVTNSALSDALTIPSSATSSVNTATEKISVVEHISHAIANTIADIRGVPRPYPDEDPDVGPSGDPYINGWDFPSLDATDPDPGGTDPDTQEDRNRAADVVAGLGFVTSFMTSFFNVSKGFNLVYTIGISFVIFSVIIGASHFFGALMGTHEVNGPTTIKELNASREQQIRVQQRDYQKSLKHKRLTG